MTRKSNFFDWQYFAVSSSSSSTMGKAENLIEKQEKSFKTLRSFMDSAAEMIEMNLGNLKSAHSEILCLKDDHKILKFEAYKDRYNEMINNLENAFRILSFSENKVKKEPGNTETKTTIFELPKPLAPAKNIKEPLKTLTPYKSGSAAVEKKPEQPTESSNTISKNEVSDMIEKLLQQKLSKSEVESNNSLVPRTLNVDNSRILNLDNSRTLNTDNSRNLNTYNTDNSRALNTYNTDNSRTLNVYNTDNSRIQNFNSFNYNHHNYMMSATGFSGFGTPASRGCSCRTGCDTRRCGCVKRGERCTSACHIGNSFCCN